ncbi:MAG: FxsA cytoplasmic rane protein [Marmoricola sp.]|nr:FxsA cytoplasmic rane protein [Marmoricola sp.]
MRRSFPWWLLLVAFILVPIAEIYVLIKVGQVIGVWWTVLLLIADSAFGSWLIRHQGSRAWRALRVALAEGRMPARELADGILIVIGGTLMISPGFVTDVFGMVLILPFTRPLGRRFLARALARRLGPLGVQSWNVRRPEPPSDVVQGDVVEPGDPG